MDFGFCGKIIRVELSKGKVNIESLGKSIFRDYLSGSGIAAKILTEEYDNSWDPFDANSPIVFMAGLLTGTPVPTACKASFCARSPQTQIWDEATVGGYWGAELKSTGYDGIVFTGKAEKPVYLWINEDEIYIKSAQSIWGLNTYLATNKLLEATDSKAQVACVGQAGENLCRMASVMIGGRESRAAARGGLGAVMGSKMLKAVVVRGSKRPTVKEKEKLLRSIRKTLPSLKENTVALSAFGTANGMFSVVEPIGDLPIKNFIQGKWEGGARKTTGETLIERFFARHYGCFGCPIRCGKVIKLSKKSGKEERLHAPEYESNAALGALCLNDSLEAISEANDWCNRYGLDAISTGVTIAFAIEAYEKNLLTKSDTDGIELTWGNSQAIIEIIHKIARREGIGDLLADGTREAVRRIGQNSDEFAIHVKGLEVPMHDPRAFASMALNYATGNRGACHLDTLSYTFEQGPPVNGLPYDHSLNLHDIKGKAEITVRLQNYMACFNALGLCKFLFCGKIGPPQITEWLNLVTGWTMTPEELIKVGERLFNLKRIFNCRLGISRKDDFLPLRLLTLDRKKGGARGSLPHLGKMLGEYYDLRGWTEEGIPSQEKLHDLGLK
ncbi:MAG: aldehyde ferredoxin oxidoreductase family protein [bacterium]